jgi:hypothetical protein
VAGATHTNDAAQPSPRSSTQAKPPAPAATNPSTRTRIGIDHNDTRDGYLGVSHASCNLAAGANKANSRRPEPYVQQPYRWSRRWCDDPPIGTINFDGGRNPEIYVGNGEWQPLNHTPGVAAEKVP